MNSEEIKRILDAYCSKEFQSKLQNVREKIMDGINSIVREIKEKEESIYLSDFIESRIKDERSLQEKLFLKGYFNELESIPKKISKIQDMIIEKIPDLIGFRVNCYFIEDEEYIQNEILKLYKNCVENMELELDNKSNSYYGQQLRKFNGKYKYNNSKYRFELQIKSMLHNTWSEIDHDEIYKRERYDIFSSVKGSIVNSVAEITKQISAQLKILTEELKEERDFIYGLFSLYTYESVKNKTNIDKLGRGYEKFYNLCKYCEEIDECVREFVIARLKKTPNDFKRKRLFENIEENTYDDLIAINKLLVETNDYNKLCFEAIFSEIINFDNQDDLLRKISFAIYKKCHDDWISNNTGDIENDPFKDENERTETFIVDIEKILQELLS